MPGSDGGRTAEIDASCSSPRSRPNSELKSEMRRMTVPDGLSNMDSPVNSTDGIALRSSWTDPTRILSPALIWASLMRLPLTLTPLVDFRSTIHQWLFRASTRACLRETDG